MGVEVAGGSATPGDIEAIAVPRAFSGAKDMVQVPELDRLIKLDLIEQRMRGLFEMVTLIIYIEIYPCNPP